MTHVLLISSVLIAGSRIAIATVWTLAAFIASTFHYYNYREAARNQHAVRNSGPLGVEIAKMLVRMEQDRLLNMVILVLVGIGAMLGTTWAGWGLLALPFIGILGSLANRRSRARQKVIVEAQLEEMIIAKKVIIERGPEGNVIAKADIPPVE